MNRLELLRKANPQLPIYSIYDEAFCAYGRIITENTENICKTAEAAVDFPEEGSRYFAALEALDTLPEAEIIRNRYCGQLDEQIGLCLGHSSKLNALEWHTCSEFNVAVRELVLLLAKRKDMDNNNRLNSAAVQAFYLAKGEMVEVFADTLHFCPCEVTKRGFSCLVALQRGTNLPLETSLEKSPLLWAKNKWLIGHEDNAPLIARGAFPGIYGENLEIHTID